ncbi:MAG: radical SAM protein [Candidatus Omnitrophica bacterium]|nr:radical SAM protein [Candidatus Omnitrophota bacterium]
MISDELFYRVKDNLKQVKGPYCIDLILGKTCNLKCKYCWGGKRQPQEDYLSENVLKKLLDSARELEVKEISLTSAIGEPMLFKNLEFLMKEIKLNGFIGSILTNGSLLGRNFADFLKRIKWDLLILSLDSFNPDVQYSLRPSPEGQEYLKGILEFLEFCRSDFRNMCLNLNMVVNALNYRDIEEYFRQAESYGVRNITLLKLVKMNKDYTPLALTQSQLSEFKNIISNMRTPVSFNRLEWLGEEDCLGANCVVEEQYKTRKNCYYHLYKVLIDYDGQVLVCNGNASDKTIFNIHDKPLKDIYHELVRLYASRRNDPPCYDICCSPIKTINQEIDLRLLKGE